VGRRARVRGCSDSRDAARRLSESVRALQPDRGLLKDWVVTGGQARAAADWLGRRRHPGRCPANATKYSHRDRRRRRRRRDAGDGRGRLPGRCGLLRRRVLGGLGAWDQGWQGRDQGWQGRRGRGALRKSASGGGGGRSKKIGGADFYPQYRICLLERVPRRSRLGNVMTRKHIPLMMSESTTT
jgi:hypothetical protein